MHQRAYSAVDKITTKTAAKASAKYKKTITQPDVLNKVLVVNKVPTTLTPNSTVTNEVHLAPLNRESAEEIANELKSEIKEKTVTSTTKDIDDEFELKVNTAGKFSLQQIDEYVTLATQNKSAIKVMLGKYLDGGPNSYIQRAGSDHTYFDMGATKWKEAEALVGKNADEMWKINKEFIDKQKALNKEFYFSQEPWKAQTHEYLSKEAEYLIDLGAKDFQKINADTWKVIW